MSTHPLPPTGLDELVEAYRQTVQAVIDLGYGCRDEDFARETDCPGWTLRDQISHVAGVESRLAGIAERRVEVPDHPWLRSDTAREIERSVELRRSQSGPQVVAELQRLLPTRLEQLGRPGLTEETEVEGPFGPMPLGRLLTMRVNDVWCHEQDIRGALERPGNLDSPGAAQFTSTVLEAFARRIHRLALPVGTAVIVESTGPVTARAGVRMIDGEDGPQVERLFTGESDPTAADEAVTTIRLSTQALTRRGAGRASVAHTPHGVDGDEAVAEAVLESLVVTP